MKYSLNAFVLFFFLSIPYANCQNQEKSESGFIVGLRNGNVIHPQSLQYKAPMFTKPFLLVNGEEKIEVEKVQYYQDETGYYVWKYVNDFEGEVKLKREISGEISAYSRITTQYMYNEYGGSYSSTRIDYFQKGYDSVEKIKFNNLRLALYGNDESIAKMNEVKVLRAINATAYVVGAGLIIGGIAHTSKLNEESGSPPYDDVSVKISPLLFVGAAAFTIPLFTAKPKREKMLEAIRIYNR